MPNPALSLLILFPEDVAAVGAYCQKIQAVLTEAGVTSECLVVVDPEEINALNQQAHPVKCAAAPAAHYGAAFRAGIDGAAGTYIIHLEMDLVHPEKLILKLWEAREEADLVIASRYVPGGKSNSPVVRRVLSRIGNQIFSRGLGLSIEDMTSAYRIYRRSQVQKVQIAADGFEVLQEALVKYYVAGYTIAEIPFNEPFLKPRLAWERLLAINWDYVKTHFNLWRLRNSIASADYDHRAFHSWVPPQRYWQRQRYKHISALLKGQEHSIDVGCGSSQIISSLPEGSLAIDILLNKLRYSRRYKNAVLSQASIFALPVPDASTPCVVCSQVIEHVPREGALEELDRVLQKGGLLILGTPDYSKWQWIVIERLYGLLLPQAYADEHITHYTYQSLLEVFVTQWGYQLEEARYILQGELILALRKPE